MRYSGFFRRGEHPHHHHHHLRRVRHNKWLAFRALTGKVEERFQNQRHEEQGSKGGKPLAHLALGLAMSTVVVLCALSDRPFAHNLPLQGMLQACFCLVAAVLYAIYMIMSRMLHFILTNSQEDSLSRSPYPSPDEDFLEDEQDNNNNSSSSRNEEEEAVTETQTESVAAAAEAAVVAPKKRRKRESLQHINRGTTGEFHWLLSYNDDDNEDEDDDHDVEEEDITDTSALLSRAGVPREVVISSMYMGGSGAFLAIQPLCMWEIDCSCAFIFALLCISAFTEYTRSRRLLLCSISLTLILALVLIFLSSSTTANTTFNLNTNNITSHHGYNNNINSNIYAAAWMWPRLLLAVASPLLLRAGGGGAGSAFYHSMTSSETLETGLPVSVLLAILVLCWYSPIQDVFYESRAQVPLWAFVPLMVVVPPYLAATLALLLYSFRAQCVTIATAILSFVLGARQCYTVFNLQASSSTSLFLGYACMGSALMGLVDVCVLLVSARSQRQTKKPTAVEDAAA